MLSLLRWGLLLLVTLHFAPVALAADEQRRAKAKAPRNFTTLRGGHLLRRDAATAFQRMSTAARQEGIWLQVHSAWRSRAKQRYLYQLYRQGYGPKAARPGRSNHQRGTAMDLVVGDTSSRTYVWLSANACRYGFKRTVSSEPWHWEYRPRATRKPAKGLDCNGQPLPQPPAAPQRQEVATPEPS
jgi:D-alanyl-D-alanine carboxypeptidase